MLTVRHPLGFASTMMRYSSSLGLAHWGNIWMRYMTEALRACTNANVSIALVSHSGLVHHLPIARPAGSRAVPVDRAHSAP